MKPVTTRTPILIVGLSVVGAGVFAANAFCPAWLEGPIALIGIGVFVAGMVFALVSTVRAIWGLSNRSVRHASGKLAAIATIMVSLIIWGGVLITLHAVKVSMSERTHQ
jgi:hypothetical protein